MARKHPFRRRSRRRFQSRPLRSAVEQLEPRLLLASVPASLDLPGTRTALVSEGLLVHLADATAIGGGGEERTGWTDVRHPAFPDVPTALSKDETLGFDRSDNFVMVHNVIVENNTGTTAQPNIARDYDFANQIYAQLGVAVLNEDVVTASYSDVDANVDSVEAAVLGANNRSPNPQTINNSYVSGIDHSNPNVVGIAFTPDIQSATGVEPHIQLEDGTTSDAFAHEVGHMLLDGFAFDDRSLPADQKDRFHADSSSELMFPSGHHFPNITKQDGNAAPSQPGTIDFDQFDDDVRPNPPVFDNVVMDFSSSATLTIPDDDTVVSTVSVGDFDAWIDSATLTLDIAHPHVEDLDVFLVSPEGKRVELFTDVGGNGANFTDTSFDDFAPVAITSGTAPFTGTFAPEGGFSLILDTNPTGDWQLEITDDLANSQTGTLNSWTLTLTLTDPFETSQVDAIFAPDTNGLQYVQRPNPNAGRTAGDFVDFSWLEDNGGLESSIADNTAFKFLAGQPVVSDDDLLFHVGSFDETPLNEDLLACDDRIKCQEPWLSGSEAETSLTAYGDGQIVSFTVVDVVSQIARYADMDTDAAGNWSRRASALDYELEFSADGELWVPGVPVRVFVDGWTTASTADDFVARWVAPFPSQFARVRAVPNFFDGHDGNTQIDALIAGELFGGISGHVYYDQDLNFERGASEPGLAGRTVYLDINHDDQFNDSEPTAVTDAAGQFEFVDIPAGVYSVAEATPEGWFMNTPAPQASFEVVVVDQTVSAVNGSPIEFGVALDSPGEIEGVVWWDDNENGIRETALPAPELPLANWTVFLDANQNGVLDADEAFTVTDSMGEYRFQFLESGTHHVVQQPDTNWANATGSEFEVQQTFPTTNHVVNLAPGEVETGIDFGVTLAETYSGPNVTLSDGQRDALLEGLQALQLKLSELSGHDQFGQLQPLLNQSFGDRLDLGEWFGEEFVAHVNSYFQADDDPTSAELAESLATVSVVQLNFQVAGHAVELAEGPEVHVSVFFADQNVEAERPVDIDFTGLMQSDLVADVSDEFQLELAFGVTPDENGEPTFFTDIAQLQARTVVSQPEDSPLGLRGFTAVEIEDHESFVYLAEADVQFLNPDNDAAGRLSTDELLGNAIHSLAVITPSPENDVNIVIPVQTTVGSYSTEDTNPTLTISSSDPFSGLPADHAWNDDADDLATFETAEASEFAELLSQLGDWLQGILDIEAFQFEIPFSGGLDLSTAIDLGTMFDGSIGNWLFTTPEAPAFQSAQELVELLTDVTGYPVDATLDFDPLSNELTFRIELQQSLELGNMPFELGLDISPVAGFSTSANFDLVVLASFDMTVGIDLTPLGADFTLDSSTILDDLNAGAGVPVADGDDLVIHFRNGQSLAVDLSGLTTVGQVLDLLNADARLSASISVQHDALLLEDLTDGEETFEVSLGSSLAAAALGNFGQDEDGDGQLLGRSLHGEKLSDRFFIRDTDLVGEFSLEAPDVDATLSLFGLDLQADNGEAFVTGIFNVKLVDPGTPSGGALEYDGKITISELVSAVIGGPEITLDSLLPEPQITGSAGLYFDEISGGFAGVIPDDPQLAIEVPDLTQPGPPQVAHNLQIADFAQLDTDSILGLLGEVAGFLETISGQQLLDFELPVIHTSVGDLLSIGEELQSAVSSISLDPSSSLEDLETALESALAIPQDGLILDYDADAAVLNVSLSFQVSNQVALPLNLDLEALGVPALPAIVDVSGGGNIDVDVSAEVNLDLGMDLSEASSPAAFVYDSTSIEITLDVDGDNLDLAANVGPLGIFVIDGAVDLNADGQPATSTGASVAIDLINDAVDHRYELAGLGIDDVTMSIAGGLHVDLPLYFPTEATPLDDQQLSLTVDIPSLQVFFDDPLNPGAISIVTPDIAAAIDNLDLLSNLYVIVDGIDWLLSKVQSGLNNTAFTARLPLIGDQLQEAGQFIESFREGFLEDLHDFLVSHPATPASMQQAIFELLGPLGINILGDVDDDLLVTQEDVLVDAGSDGVQFDFMLTQSLQLASASVDFDIGLAALGLDVDADIELRLGYEWLVSFGVDKTDGFYIDTSQTDELRVELEATIPDSSFEGRLVFLQLDVTDSPTDPSHLSGAFVVDLVEPSGTTQNGRITLSEITSGAGALAEIIDARFVAEADVNLDLRVSFGGSAVFPSLVAQFNLDWIFDSADPSVAAGEFGSRPVIGFSQVGIDLGSFLSDFARPIIEKLKVVLDPLEPAVAVLQKPLPILSDIDAAVNLLDLDGNNNVSVLELAIHLGVGGEQLEYVNDFLKVYTLFQKISALTSAGPGENLTIEVGSFDLGDLDVREMSDLQQVGLAELNLDVISDALSAIPEGVSQFATEAIDFFASAALDEAAGPPTGVGAQQSVFEFPLFEEPVRAFRLLLGQDVALVTYDLKPLDASFMFSQFIPIFWWLGIEIEGGLGANADLAFGYDTRGLRDFVESDFQDFEDIFNGFYVSDRLNADGTGPDIPEFKLWGFLTVAGALNAGVASASIGGGIEATIEGDLNDLDGDGRFRIDELIQTFPHCMIDIQGELKGGAFARVKIGLGKISYTKKWDLAEKILASFNYKCDVQEPFLATDLGDGLLRLNMGPSAHARVHVDVDGDAGESFEVTRSGGAAGNESVIVSAFGYSQTYSGVGKIIADGGKGHDIIVIDPAVQAAVELAGGNGNDTLSAGLGDAVLYGNDGDDQLVGGMANDFLFGGPGEDLLIGLAGNDRIEGGSGNDDMYGDEGRDTLLGGRDDDLLFGGDDDDDLRGEEGDDQLEGGDGDDTLRGDSGSDILNAGPGNDYVEGGSGNDQVLAGHGDDTVFAGSGIDVVFGGLGKDLIDGGADNDTLEGEDGDDTLIGNAGNDSLIGGPGDDDLSGGSGRDWLEGNADHDWLRGGGGNDDLFGDAGNDQLFGDGGNDVLIGGVGHDLLSGDNGHDFLHGEDGNDTLLGGNGQDWLSGEDGNDLLEGGNGIDELLGGDDNDTLSGGAGDDLLNAHDGNDRLLGGPGRDRLAGEAGDDWMSGGDHADLLIGSFGSDTLLGGFGNDVIVGHEIGNPGTNNGEYIEGGPDDDYICGTDGIDEVYGGTSDLGYEHLSPITPPEPLVGGFAIVSCLDPEEPIANFPYEPDVDDELDALIGQLSFLAEVTGRKFLDANGNGIFEASESGFGGVVIFADLDLNGQLDDNEPQDVTDIDGQYHLVGLLPGLHVIREQSPAGFVVTAPQAGAHEVELAGGDLLENVDFGNAPLGAISGFKWDDTNGDGLWSIGETTLSGVQIYVDSNINGQFDVGERSTTTNALGHYTLSNIPPGPHLIREVVPAGFLPTSPSTYQPQYVEVVAGQTTTGIHFGNVRPQSISGRKWSDLNGNSVHDAGEPYLEGVTIYIDLNNNGSLDRNEPTTITSEDDPRTETDELGFYQFFLPFAAPLELGGFYVREVVPEGYEQTFPTIGFHFVLSEQGEATDRDFGNAPLVEIHGAIWNDVNGNGGWDDSELGLPDIVVYLDQNENGMLDASDPQTTTSQNDPTVFGDQAGRYSFTELLTGKYLVRADVPGGYSQSYPTSFTHDVTLLEPSFVEHINFGLYEHGIVRGTKWVDSDGDGVRGRTELGLGGVTIYSDLNGNHRFDDHEPNTITMYDDLNTTFNEEGQYELAGLIAGSHTIHEVTPYGYVVTSPLFDDPGSHTVNLAAGQIISELDFGNQPVLGDITGSVWFDVDQDGVRDSDDHGLAGIQIFLDENSNGRLDAHEIQSVTQCDDPSTRDDERGRFDFRGILGGSSTVHAILADRFDQTTPDRGQGVSVTIVPLDTVSGIEFGVAPRAAGLIYPEAACVNRRSVVGGTRAQNAEAGTPRFETVFTTSTADPRGDNGHQHHGSEGRTESPAASAPVLESPADSDHDYGDLPGLFPTLSQHNGARHLIDGGFLLGAMIDGEPNGQPHVSAEGDDKAGEADEDGVLFETPLVKGGSAEIQVTNSVTGFLNGWLDANGDGDFDDLGEQIFDGMPLAPGTHSLTLLVPATEQPLESIPRAAARFRFSSVQELDYFGLAPNGEVEDYAIPVAGQPQTEWPAAWRVGPATIVEGNAGTSTLTFVVTATAPSAHPVSIAYTTLDGTAVAGLDYEASAGTIIVPPAATAVEIQVPIIGELVVEDDETLFLQLTDITGATIALGQATGTIENDDSPNPNAGEISGVKWLDQNENGTRDEGEPGEPGIRIYVDLNRDGDYDVGEPTALTTEDNPVTPINEAGHYQIAAVPPGNQFVREVVPDGWTQTFPPEGHHHVDVPPVGTLDDLDFGNIVLLPDGDDQIFAAAEGDVIYGDNLVNRPEVRSIGTREDFLDGQSGEDQIFGQERDDQLIGGEDADALDGGDGLDRVIQISDTDQTLTDNLLTGQGPDTLVSIELATLIGGGSDNTIDASGFTLGPVILMGLDGDDHLIGSPNDDLLVGGHGNDLIEGLAGDDWYIFETVTSGIAEVDTLVELPGEGVDTLDFETLLANDPVTVDLSQTNQPEFGDHLLRTLRVEAGQVGVQPAFEDLIGGAGHDTLTGNDSENRIEGRMGHDLLSGRAAADRLYGHEGEDQLNGGTEDDLLVGGMDSDYYRFEEAWGADTVVESGGLDDFLDFAEVTSDLLVQIGPLFVTDGSHTMNVAGGTLERVETGSGNDTFEFLHDAATLADGSGHVDGGPGNDQLDYSAFLAAAVSVDLAAGSATGLGSVAQVENVTGGAGNDMLAGDDFTNLLLGGGGHDLLAGRDGDDTLEGGPGHDTLTGGAGNDTVRGNDGDDVYSFGTPTGVESDILAEQPGEGSDTIEFSTSLQAVVVDLGQDVVVEVESSGRQIAVEVAGQADHLEAVVGTALNDVLIANGFSNRIAGLGGDDRYVLPDGLTGTVQLAEDPGSRDLIDFAGFTSPISFDLSAAVNNPVVGLSVTLTNSLDLPAPLNFEDLTGGSAADLLTGHGGDNRLSGGDGADTLIGGGGSDDLRGGGGGDHYPLGIDAGSVVVDESNDDPGSQDTLDFLLATGPVTIDLDSNSSQAIAPGHQVQLLGRIESLVGSTFADTIHAGATSFPRTIDGHTPALPAVPGDRLFFNAQGNSVSFDGDQIFAGESAPLTRLAVETLFILNAQRIAVDAGALGDDGVHDSFTVARNATDSFVVVNGSILFHSPVLQTPPLTIEGSSDDDTLLVSFASGTPIPQGLTYHGNQQVAEDTLILFGAGADSGVYEPDPATFGNGTLTIGTSTIEFTGLEPVLVHDFQAFTFVSGGSQDDLSVAQMMPGQNRILGTSDGVPFEVLDFYDIPSVTIDAATNDQPGRDDDQITFLADLTASRLESLAVLTGSGTARIESDAVTFRLTEQNGVSTFESTPVAHVRRQTDEDAPLWIELPRLDQPIDPQTIQLSGTSQLAGEVTVEADGRLRYSPATALALQQLSSGQSTVESFDVTVGDAAEPTLTATVNMTVHGVNDWHNPGKPFDVNDSDTIEAFDVLFVINDINKRGAGELPGIVGRPEFFLDTNNDNFLTSIDVLGIINWLNSMGSGEAESGNVSRWEFKASADSLSADDPPETTRFEATLPRLMIANDLSPAFPSPGEAKSAVRSRDAIFRMMEDLSLEEALSWPDLLPP